MTTPSNPRKLLFVYPSLPKYEIRFYFIILISCLIYAWYSVIQASNDYAPYLYRAARSQREYPLIGPRTKDLTNWEWSRWSQFAVYLIPYYVLHSVLFNTASTWLSPSLVSYLTIFYSVGSCCYLFTSWLVTLSIAQGSLIFAVTHMAKRTLAVWFSAVPLLYYTMNYSIQLTRDPFLVLIFVAYTLLSYISYNLEVLRNNSRPQDDNLLKRYIRMLFYAFYPPYLISLIVTYPDFERQISEREKRNYNWRQLLQFIARIAFWWIVIENLLYFSYHEAMLVDINFAARLPKDQFVSLGMALGQFFHLKYVVIFGLPTIFAHLDKMQPAEGPICIARVTLYSKIWRSFDRGLYAFFKTYIFLPICQPTFSFGRKIMGVIISYSFVLLWHGLHYHNIVWIILNIVELFVEYGAKGFYSTESVRMFREKHISDRCFRRILAWLQIVPFVFGLYSNFYFLGGAKVGYLFIQRIWNEETLTLQYPFFLLISLGYCYTHVTMELERYLSSKPKTS